MTHSSTERSDLVARLRAEFDDAFAQPAGVARPSYNDFLLLRAGDQRCALRVTDISAVAGTRTVTPIPDAPPVVCGVVGVRSLVAVVYDLAMLLGGTRCSRGSIVLAAAAPDVGFAFDALAGHLRVDRDDRGDGADGPAAVLEDGERWQVVRVAAVLDQIRQEMDVRSATGGEG